MFLCVHFPLGGDELELCFLTCSAGVQRQEPSDRQQDAGCPWLINETRGVTSPHAEYTYSTETVFNDVS